MYRPTPKNIKEPEIYAIIEKHQLSYAEIGRAARISRDYVSLLLRKRRPITRRLMLRMFDLFLLYYSALRKANNVQKKGNR